MRSIEAIAAGWPHWLETVAKDALLVVAGGAALFGLGSAIFIDPRPPMLYNPTTGTYSV